jgi:Fe-S-cluster containining protein
MSVRARYAELCAKVDAFFAKAHAASPGEGGITCHAGCSECCRRRFSVTRLEAEAIEELLAALPDDRRAALAERALRGDPGVCPALDADGRCAVYAARPLICRSHGLPIRFQPGLLDACPKNFAGRDLASLPADLILDQTTLSTILGALDAAHAAETGRPRGERVEIAALLARSRR